MNTKISADKVRIILTPRQAPNPRAGWESQFSKAGAKRVREDLWGGVPQEEAWDRMSTPRRGVIYCTMFEG